MFCSNCGKELPENAKFCLECGQKAAENSAETGAIPTGEVPQAVVSAETPKKSNKAVKIIVVASVALIFIVLFILAMCQTVYNGRISKIKGKYGRYVMTGSNTYSPAIITLEDNGNVIWEQQGKYILGKYTYDFFTDEIHLELVPNMITSSKTFRIRYSDSLIRKGNKTPSSCKNIKVTGGNFNETVFPVLMSGEINQKAGLPDSPTFD